MFKKYKIKFILFFILPLLLLFYFFKGTKKKRLDRFFFIFMIFLEIKFFFIKIFKLNFISKGRKHVL